MHEKMTVTRRTDWLQVDRGQQATGKST